VNAGETAGAALAERRAELLEGVLFQITTTNKFPKYPKAFKLFQHCTSTLVPQCWTIIFNQVKRD
jgi:anionic cell wall polymer biosynthesis LytR-Cps2A-Psr (LCP) family protein